MEIRHKDIADRIGLTLGDLHRLPDGVTANLANRLRLSQGDVQRFITGEWPSVNPSVDCSARLGLSQSAAKDLSDSLGRDGRLGLLLGLLFPRN